MPDWLAVRMAAARARASPRPSSLITGATSACAGSRIRSGFSRSARSWGWTGTRAGSPPACSTRSSAGSRRWPRSSASTCAAGAASTRATRPASCWRSASGPGSTATALADASRLVAKVDSAAVQDGFELYLHGFIITVDGTWCVVQQGMNVATKQARRYHWLSEGLASFVDSPHAAIEGRARTHDPERHRPARGGRAARDARARDRGAGEGRARARADRGAARRALRAGPERHGVRAALAWSCPRITTCAARTSTCAASAPRSPAAKEAGPRDFAELLRTPGVGARTVFSLALVAEVVHGAPTPLRRSRALLARARRERRPSVPGAAARVR